jgi:hypothetical protein
MVFRIERASEHIPRKEKPCENSFLIEENNDEWESNIYGIRINTLEELMNFMKKNGDVVIKNKDNYDIFSYDTYPTIIIYDGYLE